MVKYRRNYHQGGACYFFTVALRNRSANYLTTHINLLRNAMRSTMQEYPYEIKATVILPDHLHTVWQLPEHDHNYSLRWRKIKRYLTLALKSKGLSFYKNKRGENYL